MKIMIDGKLVVVTKAQRRSFARRAAALDRPADASSKPFDPGGFLADAVRAADYEYESGLRRALKKLK